MSEDYIFIIKDSIIHMLSGKYKFSMESFYKNIDNLFKANRKPEVTPENMTL